MADHVEASTITTGSGRGAALRLWVSTIAAAMTAAIGAWAIGESVYGYFRAPMRPVLAMGYLAYQTTPKDLVVANIKNATMAYGIFGGLVGMAMGLASGSSRRDFRAGVVASVVGLVVGTVLTALLTVPSLVGYWAYFGESPLTEELLIPLLTHAVSWAGVGIAGGLALGIGVGAERSVLVQLTLAGLVGAVVGTVLYEFVGAALFPLDRTTFPLSASSGSRLLARTAVAGGVALFALRALRTKRERGHS